MLSSNWARLTLFSQLSAAEVFFFLGTPLSFPFLQIQGIQWAWVTVSEGQSSATCMEHRDDIQSQLRGNVLFFNRNIISVQRY